MKENHNDYISDVISKLLIDAADFRITVFGDGATIVKCLLTNIGFAGEIFCVICLIICNFSEFHKIFFIILLLTGRYGYQVLMDVVNSSKNMAEGGIKEPSTLPSRSYLKSYRLILTECCLIWLCLMVLGMWKRGVTHSPQGSLMSSPSMGGSMIVPSLLVKFFRSH